MRLDLAFPDSVSTLARRVRDAGGRAYLVGGSVRDHLLGRPVKDWDVEVYGVDPDRLERLVAPLGRLHAVGRSFGVLKLATDDGELDVSVPRRDSKVGPGHKGIAVVGDPTLSIEEACRRRDLTVNAMLVDVLTGELHDPFGGADDLRAGLLRAVDADTFLEDPLRALRVVQFAARFSLTPDPELLELCTRADLHELPAERIRDELFKLLLQAPRPSVGLAIARRTRALDRVLPELAGRDHPDVDRVVDALARDGRDVEPAGRRLALMLAGLAHRCAPPEVEATLDRLALHRWDGYPLRDRVLAAIAHASDPIDTDAALRWLSTVAEPELTLRLRDALRGDASEALARCAALGILHAPPPRLLLGRHLTALGAAPGPELGRVLDEVYGLQLDGRLADLDAAIAVAKERLAR